MLKDLARKFVAGLVAAVMIGVAAGIVLVAAAFAVYAGMKTFVSPAAASAVTALAFAAVAGLIAVVAPRVIRGKRAALSEAPTHPAAGPAAQVAVVLLGIIGDMARSRRLKRQEKARHFKHARR